MNESTSTVMGSIYSQLFAVADRVDELAEALENHANRLFGPRPETNEKEPAATPVPDSALDRIESQLLRISLQLTRAEEAYKRNIIA